MSLMTIETATTGGQDPYNLGRADAYDDAQVLTLDQLVVRAGTHTDLHPDVMYAVGYMARVLEMRLELDAVTAAETELAYTPHPARTVRSTA